MKTVLAALKLVLADLSKLSIPTYATAAAGVLAPIIAAIAGASVTPAEVGGWLLIAGGAAAAVEKLASGQAKAALKK